MRIAQIEMTVTTDTGRFAGRTGRITEICPQPNEVWVRWEEGAFITNTIESVHTLRAL